MEGHWSLPWGWGQDGQSCRKLQAGAAMASLEQGLMAMGSCHGVGSMREPQEHGQGQSGLVVPLGFSLLSRSIKSSLLTPFFLTII